MPPEKDGNILHKAVVAPGVEDRDHLLHDGAVPSPVVPRTV